MAKTVPLSARIDARIDQRLRKLSAATRRSRSYLVGEALERFTQTELDYLASIEEGRAAIRRGDYLTHDEVLRGIKARGAARVRKQRP